MTERRQFSSRKSNEEDGEAEEKGGLLDEEERGHRNKEGGAKAVDLGDDREQETGVAPKRGFRGRRGRDDTAAEEGGDGSRSGRHERRASGDAEEIDDAALKDDDEAELENGAEDKMRK